MPKTPKIRKTNAGLYYIQGHFTVNGEVFRPTFSAYSKAECIDKYKDGAEYYRKLKQAPRRLTVRQAIEKYIKLSETLSPSTLSNYEHMLKTAFTDIMDVDVEEIDDAALQAAINREAKRPSRKHPGRAISAKTVKNEAGLLSAALGTICGKQYRYKLPRIQREFKKLPEPEEAVAMVRGTEIELPCLLAMWLSFRRSEVLGLRCSSVRDGYIFIDQVVVYVDGQHIAKEDAKTAESKRKRLLPGYLVNLIEKTPQMQQYRATGADAPLVDITSAALYHRFKALATAAGFPAMTFHDLRHLFASSGAVAGIVPLYLAKMGGWSTPAVMEAVYQQTFDSKMRQAEEQLNAHFERMINDIPTAAPETQTK